MNLLSRLQNTYRVAMYRFMKLAFNALYYTLAPLYDKISYYSFLGQWPKWQQSVLPRIQGKRVLEIGCGTGSLLTEILERGYKAYGVDASPRMLAQARKKLAAAGFPGRLVQADIRHLPFPDNSFETVISTFPTEYITDLAVLNEIQRVLYPGGRLVVVDAAELKPFNLPAKILVWLYRNVLGYGGHSVAGMRLPLAQAGLIRRDETFEDAQGEAHIIIALKAW
jgi:ubiquinone/menaquinone biosynthesis C-methylase UbiE